MSAYASIQALFQRTYGDFINPMPSDNTIAKAAPFISQSVRPGENYNFPVRMSLEHGVTHNVDNTAFSLNSVVDSTVVNAQLDGATVLLAGNIPYDVIAKSINGDASYQQAMDYKVETLMLSGELYRELNLLYGPGTGSAAAASVGTVNASVSGANLAAPQIVNITAATWAPGIWNNMINAIVDVYQSDGTTVRAADVTVQAVVAGTNRLQLYKAASSATVVAGDVIVLRGQRTKGCYGVQALLENSGTMFGIAASTYPQWQALSFSAGSAALTVAKIQQMFSRLKNNGLKAQNGRAGTLFVSAATFADLVSELDGNSSTFPGGNRWVNPSGDAKVVGTDNISVKTPCGMCDIAIHTYMKQGIAMFLPEGKVKRVGATDLTFSLPGTNKWFYTELPSNAGCQIRIYSHQAIVIEVPYHAAIITAIVNTAGTSPA